MTIIATPGAANANSFVDMASANLYFASRPWSTTWTGIASDTLREPYLIHATRLMEYMVTWYGVKTTTTQSLDWPRTMVQDPDYPDTNRDIGVRWIDSTIVPQDIQDACCELALALITSDRTQDASSRGLKRAKVGSLEVEFDPSTAPPVMPRAVRNILSLYGRFAGSGGSVELVRA